MLQTPNFNEPSGSQLFLLDDYGVPPEGQARSGDLAMDQVFTPVWAAEQLIETFFPDLSSNDLVIDAGCGPGAFLSALPSHIPAIGVELDPKLARMSALNTGRRVVCGDFCNVPLDVNPTVIMGNPPFSIDVVRGFLTRAYSLLPKDGRCGFLLPSYSFQSSHTLVDWNKRWSVTQHAIPRDIFPGLSRPIVFAMFQKDEKRKLVGFALYHETNDIKRMNKQLRYILINGEPRKTSWRALVEFVLSQFGGRASLDAIYKAVEPIRHTTNVWWKEKVRQQLQTGPFFKDGDEWVFEMQKAA